MLTCKRVCENATELSEGRIGRIHRLRLRVHLRLCKHCRRFIRQLDYSMSVTRRQTATLAPSDEEIDRILRRLLD